MRREAISDGGSDVKESLIRVFALSEEGYVNFVVAIGFHDPGDSIPLERA
jgi:hypothetical protein